MLIASRTIEIDRNDPKSIFLGVTQGSLAFCVWVLVYILSISYLASSRRLPSNSVTRSMAGPLHVNSDDKNWNARWSRARLLILIKTSFNRPTRIVINYCSNDSSSKERFIDFCFCVSLCSLPIKFCSLFRPLWVFSTAKHRIRRQLQRCQRFALLFLTACSLIEEIFIARHRKPNGSYIFLVAQSAITRLERCDKKFSCANLFHRLAARPFRKSHWNGIDRVCITKYLQILSRILWTFLGALSRAKWKTVQTLFIMDDIF